MCLTYFEQHPGASVAQALNDLQGKFVAVRHNQQYYQELTVTNAHKKHCMQYPLHQGDKRKIGEVGVEGIMKDKSSHEQGIIKDKSNMDGGCEKDEQRSRHTAHKNMPIRYARHRIDFDEPRWFTFTMGQARGARWLERRALFVSLIHFALKRYLVRHLGHFGVDIVFLSVSLNTSDLL